MRSRSGSADAGNNVSVAVGEVLGYNRALEEAIVAHAATLVRPGGSVYLMDRQYSSDRVDESGEHYGHRARTAPHVSGHCSLHDAARGPQFPLHAADSAMSRYLASSGALNFKRVLRQTIALLPGLSKR